jgi:aspartokinase-like uncharacterized kinase
VDLKPLPPESPLVVVKVGGSLYDWPELGPCLRAWLAALAPARALLVPGGGPTADAIRALDRHHALSEEAAHWLALQALSLNARFLQALLPGAEVVDAHDFARRDEGRPGALPHTWDVTSDSVAARVAQVTGARRLVLLKSTDFPEGIDAREAGRRGLVDAYFARAQDEIEVFALNLRGWRPGTPALAGTVPLRPSRAREVWLL